MAGDVTGPNKRRDWQSAFLEKFAELGRLNAACDAVGVGRTTVWTERQRDEDFALAYVEAEERYVEVLQAEAHRRAVDGVEREVRFQGEVVGYERQYSDALLIFELKKRDPSYRDTYRVEHSGPDGGPIQVQAPPDAAERSRRAAQLLAEAGGLQDVDGTAEDPPGDGNGNGNGHR